MLMIGSWVRAAAVPSKAITNTPQRVVALVTCKSS